MDIDLALWAIGQNRDVDAMLAQRRAVARSTGSARAGRSGVRRLVRAMTLAIVGARARGETRTATQGGTDVRRSY